MKITVFLYGSLFIIAVVLLFFALKQYTISKKVLETGIKTKATVIDLIEINNDDGNTFKPVFEYTDYTNSIITFKSSVSTRPATYKIGDRVTIVYSKYNKIKKIVSFWGLYRWAIILLCVASPFLIISSGYFLYKYGYL